MAQRGVALGHDDDDRARQGDLRVHEGALIAPMIAGGVETVIGMHRDQPGR